MKKNEVNESFFDLIDCEEKAYLLGFFLADGCICLNQRCKNSYRLQVGLQDIDVEIIDLFHKFICPKNKIVQTNYQGGNVNHRKHVNIVKWTSTYMKNILETKYCIKERKTYDILFKFPFENIDKNFVWDFIRGYFDGDGQFSYNDISHKSTFAIYSTSKIFLEQLAAFFKEQYDVIPIIDCKQNKNVNLYNLRFNSHKNKHIFLLKIYKLFYKQKKYFLNRKKNNLQKYLMHKYRVNQEDFERLLDNVERSN